MHILHINTLDKTGGAAKAMYRLHQGFMRLGHESRLLVGQRVSEEKGIYALNEQLRGIKDFKNRAIDFVGYRLDKWLGIDGWKNYSTRLIPKLEVFKKADVINLHNLHGGYFNFKSLMELARFKPIVWTLHDMWAMTGHCAYAYDCEKWKTGCDDCPLLKGEFRNLVEPAPPFRDNTRKIWKAKRKIYEKMRISVITPSKWLFNLAKQSILSPNSEIFHIPNGVDTNVFRPLDTNLARKALDLPLDKKIIFFSAHAASHDRKGFKYLLEALEELRGIDDDLFLLISGYGQLGLKLTSMNFKARFLGPLFDEKLQRLALAASDLFVFPTLADNHPLVLLEAMACGIPAVSFDIGGVPEIVRHMETGYLAKYKVSSDLARGIRLLLKNAPLRTRMKTKCREFAVSQFSLEVQCKKYLEVYDKTKVEL